MRKKLMTLILATGLTGAGQATELEMELHNLTGGIYFTPLLFAAHDTDTRMFQSGMAASAELQMMAEGGDISGLYGTISSAGGMLVENPAGGLLGPGASVTGVMLDSGDLTQLSVSAMLLPTNDGFVGLDNWTIPGEAGTYVLYLNAYDAGTEVNDEVINGGGAPGTLGIPAAPGGDGGTNGSGVMSSEADVVHIHPGNLGDTDPDGGISDVDSRVHRWLNPVAKLIIRVQ